jgi:hypothetical protein
MGVALIHGEMIPGGPIGLHGLVSGEEHGQLNKDTGSGYLGFEST